MLTAAAYRIVLTLLVCGAGAVPAAAQEAVPAPPARLHVTGSAQVSRPPDRATLVLGVETRAEGAEAAASENTRVMEAVVAALSELGIPESRMRTRQLALRPDYRRGPGDEEPRISAYQASNFVSLDLEDVESVGRVMDVAVRAGANQVQGVYLGLEDSQEAYEEALALAAARARSKAEALAVALGVELGPMVEVVEGGAQPPVRRIESPPVPQPGPEPGAIRLRGLSVSAPVSPGEVDVQASVQITWELIR